MVFKHKGLVINGIINLSPKEVFEECNSGAMILDLRRENEIKYKSFPFENTMFARPDEVRANFENLPKDALIIVADNSGLRSKEIVLFLNEKDFENVANLIGGMFEWDKDQLPIEVNNMERLNGSCLCQMRKPRVERK